MCRLLAYAAPAPTSVGTLLGSAQADRFRSMARLHQDGWGTMWVTEPGADGVLERARYAETGHDSELLAATLHGPATAARVLHLRMATTAMDILERNTHPFVRGHVGLAHNGSIVPSAALRALAGAAAAGVEGDTDSELFFAIVVDLMDSGLTPTAALLEAVRRVREPYPSASLNLMMLTTTELVVLRSSHGSPVPWEDFVASGLAEHELPLGHSDAYFRMFYRRFADGAIAFASAGLETDGWTELPENTIATVDLQTLHLETSSLLTEARV